MIKCNIVAHITFVFGIFDLVTLGNTWADKRKFIRNIQIFFGIDCRAHQGTLYRNKLWNQFWYVMFNVIDNRWTRLWNSTHKVMLCDIFYITPSCYICAKTYTNNTICTKFFQASKNLFIITGIICRKCRCPQYGYFFSFCKCRKKFFRIINKISCMMLTGIKTCSTGDTFITIYLNALTSILSRYCTVCSNNRTGWYTFVAANAIIIGKH